MSSATMTAAEALQRTTMRDEKTRLLARQAVEAEKAQAEARAASTAKIERLRALRVAHEAAQVDLAAAKPKRVRKPAAIAVEKPLGPGVIPSEPD